MFSTASTSATIAWWPQRPPAVARVLRKGATHRRARKDLIRFYGKNPD